MVKNFVWYFIAWFLAVLVENVISIFSNTMAVILLLWRSIFFRMSRMKEWVVLTRTKDQKQCQLKDEASSCTGQNVWQICIHLIVGSISWSLMLLTMRCTLKQKKIKMIKENIQVLGLSKGNFWGPKPNPVLVVLSGPRKVFLFWLLF